MKWNLWQIFVSLVFLALIMQSLGGMAGRTDEELERLVGTTCGEAYRPIIAEERDILRPLTAQILNAERIRYSGVKGIRRYRYKRLISRKAPLHRYLNGTD